MQYRFIVCGTIVLERLRMPIAEGRAFEFEAADHIRTDFLETVDYNGNPQEITYETEEFSAVCPFSGLPDLAKVQIVYIPEKKLVELKSLKYYFVSYRDVGIFQEAATNRIYNDLSGCLNPRYLMVKTIYNIRGGIMSTCVMDSEKIKAMK
jgi:7-cyano-7-deazaguanine reductase